MRYFCSKLPIPVNCVALAFAGLGLLLKDCGFLFMLIPCLISAFICFLILCKLLLCPAALKQLTQDPVQLGTFAAHPMALMLLSVCLCSLGAAPAAKILWYYAIALHLFIIAVFSFRFLPHLRLESVHGTWFIVYVGICACAVSAPAHGTQSVSLPLLGFSMICCFLLSILAAVRYIRKPVISEEQKPLFCIFAAPFSLCLVGYLQSAPEKSIFFTAILAAGSVFLYLVVLLRLPGMLLRPFYPSHAAFTFPFVISATASRQAFAFFSGAGYSLPLLKTFAFIQTCIAILLCLLVLARYVIFLKTLMNRPV